MQTRNILDYAHRFSKMLPILLPLFLLRFSFAQQDTCPEDCLRKNEAFQETLESLKQRVEWLEQREQALSEITTTTTTTSSVTGGREAEHALFTNPTATTTANTNSNNAGRDRESCNGGIVYNNQCFKLLYTSNSVYNTTLRQAAQICRRSNGRVAEITSDEMYDVVEAYVRRTNFAGGSIALWLGSTYAQRNNPSQYITLTNGTKITLTRWLSGHPRKESDRTQLAFIVSDNEDSTYKGLYILEPTFSLRNALCAYNTIDHALFTTTQAPATATSSSINIGRNKESCNGVVVYNNQCIRLPYTSNPKWNVSLSRAAAICRRSNGRVAEITSDEMYDVVVAYVRRTWNYESNSNLGLWLGSTYSTRNNPSRLITLTNGTRITLTHWHPGHPTTELSRTQMAVIVKENGESSNNGVYDLQPSWRLKAPICAYRIE